VTAIGLWEALGWRRVKKRVGSPVSAVPALALARFWLSAGSDRLGLAAGSSGWRWSGRLVCRPAASFEAVKRDSELTFEQQRLGPDDQVVREQHGL
jgi:hypothetical protein